MSRSNLVVIQLMPLISGSCLIAPFHFDIRLRILLFAIDRIAAR